MTRGRWIIIANTIEHLHVPGSVLKIGNILILLILTMTLQEKYYHLFIDESCEAKGDESLDQRHIAVEP